MTARSRLALLLALLVAASASADGDEEMDEPPDRAETSRDGADVLREGVASWYGGWFHGRQTACGETFDENGLTAAHRTLPFGTRISVTNLANGCQVTLRITDRGPYHGTRILDLSRAAAEHLGFVNEGLARVRFDIVALPPARRGLRLGLGPMVDSAQRPLHLQEPGSREVPRAPWPLAMDVAP